ncbi:MAG: glycine zipper 2TM domain-containing protein [Gammaproteobacteria bacterium]|nr:MAG: glycine zipper 2TM domain-containing protein [Gammaproteobacteria bacterium]
MNRLMKIAALALSVGLTGCVSASPRWDDGSRFNRQHSFVDTARVVKVKPIYETVQVSVPEEQCWREKRHHHSRYRDDDSYTVPLVGAIVGGVVGNQFGEGSGKTALTVAGTLLGASVANDLRKSERVAEYRPRHYRRCEIVDRIETREEIVGYRVKYRYKGQVFRTRMDHDPGDYLRVQVTVRPIE